MTAAATIETQELERCRAVVEAEVGRFQVVLDETLADHLQCIKDLLTTMCSDLTSNMKEHSQVQVEQHQLQEERLQKQVSKILTTQQTRTSVFISEGPSDSCIGSPKSPRSLASPAGGKKRQSMTGFALNERWSFSLEGMDMTIMSDEANYEEDNQSSVGSIQATETMQEGHRCMMRPSSMKRLVWDSLSIVFIFYDLVSIPVFFAFNAADSEFTASMFMILLFFWTFDMVLSFFTGIFVKGVEILNHWAVAKHYLQSWFIVDVVVVGVDWMAVILASNRSGVAMMRMGKTLRTLRIMRTLRLLRLIKVRHLVEQLQDHISSEVFHILIKMVKLMLFVLMMNHFVACLWYWIGDNAAQGGDLGWVDVGGFDQQNLTYQYFTSLHWSLTQFTTGSMEVVAGNAVERIFSVVTLVFALMIFSSFLSSITAATTQLQQLSSEAPMKMSQLRRYMKSRAIPRGLKVRILRYVDHQLAVYRQQVQENDVELLAFLSTPLMRELKQHINQPFLIKHPFFERCAKRDRNALQIICNSAITLIPLSKGDTLFTQRASDNQMFFLVTGCLEYSPGKQRTPTNKPSGTILPTTSSSRRNGGEARMESKSTGRDEMILYSKDWCCEPSLWTYWTHVGSMHATTVSEVIALNAVTFSDIVQSHPLLATSVLHYGRGFVEQLNMLLMSGSQLTDLACVFEYSLHVLAEEAFGKKEEEDPKPDIAQSRSNGRSLLLRAASRDFSKAKLRRGQTAEMGGWLFKRVGSEWTVKTPTDDQDITRTRSSGANSVSQRQASHAQSEPPQRSSGRSASHTPSHHYSEPHSPIHDAQTDPGPARHSAPPAPSTPRDVTPRSALNKLEVLEI
mmetsp:Transcript_43910/g.103874  ORF Transcript_43910/g.103874 Transcript_43910/m.103874 type:complete len:850 (+) Transcript_43910:261-2810(+)